LACLGDTFLADGTLAPESPRTVVGRVAEHLAQLKLQAVVGPELEYFVCKPDGSAGTGFTRYANSPGSVYVVGRKGDPNGLLLRTLRGKACSAAATARPTSAAPPAATSARGCSSMGETSVKVREEATRRPPIQCRVSTATPARVVLGRLERFLEKLPDTLWVKPVLDGEQVTGVVPGRFRQQSCRAPRTPGAEEGLLRRHGRPPPNRLDPNIF
jgi:hypothetical protein